jgi:hypothetical protein
MAHADSVWFKDGKIAVRSENVNHWFDNVDDAFKHYLETDPFAHTPNYSSPFEEMTRGAINPMTPPGGEPPSGNPNLPMPDHFPEKDFNELGWAELTDWWRPKLQWFNHYHQEINKVFAKEGRYVPLYETFRGVLDKQREFDTVRYNFTKELYDQTKGWSSERLHDVFYYLADGKHDWIAQSLRFTPEELRRVDSLEQWMDGSVRTTTGADILHYMRNDWQRLRSSGFDPGGVWGIRGRNFTPGLWERLIKDEQRLDPSDTNIKRVIHRVGMSTLQDRIMGESLTKAEDLVRLKGTDGKPVLGPIAQPLSNYIKYMSGMPDRSQLMINRAMGAVVNGINTRIAEINKVMPRNWKISQIDSPPRELWNKYIMLQYVGGLGFRPAVWIRDAMQSWTSNLPSLGGKYFFRGIQDMFDPKLRDLAEQHGAVIKRMNVGEVYGDITQETSPSRMMQLSSKLLAPISGAHNIDRRIAFLGQRAKAIDALKRFVAGKTDPKRFMIDSGLWFHDETPAGMHLREASKPLLSDDVADLEQRVQQMRDVEVPINPEAAAAHNTRLGRMEKVLEGARTAATKELPQRIEALANKIALDYTYITQWPYLRGTQPGLQRTGIGRLFGQFGVWPANQLEFVRRLARKSTIDPEFKKEALKTVTMWVGANYAAVEVMKGMGADVSKWFWFSGAEGVGPQLGPTFNTGYAVTKMFRDDEEGRKARRELIEFPLQITPGNAAIRGWIRAFSRDEVSPMELLGFKPYQELERDEDMGDWLEEEFGYKQPPRGRKF